MTGHTVGGLLLLSLSAAAWAADRAIPLPTTENIIAGMRAARERNRSQLRPYKVVRAYELFGRDQKSQSQVTAYIGYVPPDVQNFTLHRNQGLTLGETIVRKILESEKDILTHRSASDVSNNNYYFRLLRRDVLNHQPCYVLELHPLRKDPRLLEGLIWVDAASYMILRMEGEPARAPSWWVHNIHVALEFRPVQGMWLQTALRSTANVRLLGEHTLVSRDVEYNIGATEAAASPVARP